MEIKWKPEYQIGISQIDNQHMRLVALMNLLEQSKINKKCTVAVDAVFAGLEDYCHYHFATEEIIMKKYSYPDYEAHKQYHRFFCSELGKMKVNYYTNNMESALLETLGFLNAWLLDHIMIADKKISYSLHEYTV